VYLSGTPSASAPLLCAGVVWQSEQSNSPGACVKPAGGPAEYARAGGLATLSVSKSAAAKTAKSASARSLILSIT
jgi:hypothetical protein